MNMIFSKDPAYALDKIPYRILVKIDGYFLNNIKSAYLGPEARLLLSMETLEIFP